MSSFTNGVYHSAKIRNFKQITTSVMVASPKKGVFITLQRYEILSKSQQHVGHGCGFHGVYHSAKIRNFKQITTSVQAHAQPAWVFITLQRYEILSKSQRVGEVQHVLCGVYHSAKIRNFKQITTAVLLLRQVAGCLSLCKDTKF